MYMRNNRYDGKYSKYNIDGFPPNYSGQFSEDDLRTTVAVNANEKEKEPAYEEHKREYSQENKHIHNDDKKEFREERHEQHEKKDNSLLGGLFKGHKDGKKGGLLSGIFGKGDKDKDGGGILSNFELEDLILIAVIFFLLKDGFDDDLILIIAIILFSS